MRGLLILLVLLPVLDLALLGHLIGFWNTVLLVLGTACLGFALIRYQGITALNTSRAKLAAGQMPLSEMTTGIFLAFAGILFIHPGFITDMLGLLCLIPGVRQLMAGWAVTRFAKAQRGPAGYAPRDDILEGEFEEVEPDKPKSLSEKAPKK